MTAYSRWLEQDAQRREEASFWGMSGTESRECISPPGDSTHGVTRARRHTGSSTYTGSHRQANTESYWHTCTHTYARRGIQTDTHACTDRQTHMQTQHFPPLGLVRIGETCYHMLLLWAEKNKEKGRPWSFARPCLCSLWSAGFGENEELINFRVVCIIAANFLS